MIFIQSDYQFESVSAIVQETITVSENNMIFLVVDGAEQLSFPYDFVYPTLSDDKGNSYIYIGRYDGQDFYYVKYTQSGETIISANYGSLVFHGGFGVLEFSNGNTLDQKNGESENLIVGTNVVSLSTPPTTVAEEGVLYTWRGFIGGTYTADPSYTLLATITSTNGLSTRVYLKNVLSTGIQNYTGSATIISPTFEYLYHQIFTFSYETPINPCTKLRGKCKLRGNIKIK